MSTGRRAGGWDREQKEGSGAGLPQAPLHQQGPAAGLSKARGFVCL